ncbi:hypothetical protein C6V04_04890 [Burkholderia multivorans]|uniref:hypothetical protein n=1 Tax=Burkholderia cepacia complex TaxID=87882 RepID=UPI000CFE9D52|nr:MULTISPECIES: hypothetical protein [Burkholderia cepacia complex]MBR8084604.1 hypothetical protein [Burkholderia vietnamiensis]PRG96541.1 hypothetical protein C6V04_04890 [Burkholderia multivorans]
MFKKALSAVRRTAGTPRLKTPRTQFDFDAIARAQAKRDRKARKLARDFSAYANAYYATRNETAAAAERETYHAIEAIA